MDPALLVLIGTLAGVIVTFLGNAILETERRTASRRDAAVDREAANLRDLQDAVSEFALVWGPIVTATIQGGAPFNPMAPANASGRPGATFSRLASLAHRTQVEAIRTLAHDWAGRQYEFIRTGQPLLIANMANQRQTLDAEIAVRIRTLEAPPPTLANRIETWWNDVGH